VIDEAQSLSGELLEEIRLLANSETATEKLLPLVLAGQPELRARLNESGLRQLKQRVTLRCEIVPLTQHETAAYIAQRIRTAGGDAARLFTRQAVMLIHERSGGIPRTISVVCDNALLTGFALGRQPVDSEVVLDVAHDFDLGGRKLSDSSAQPQVEMVPEPPDRAAHVALDAAPQDAPAESAPEDDPDILASGVSRRPSRFSLFGRH
jgi:general secretion pathway protein A